MLLIGICEMQWMVLSIFPSVKAVKRTLIISWFYEELVFIKLFKLKISGEKVSIVKPNHPCEDRQGSRTIVVQSFHWSNKGGPGHCPQSCLCYLCFLGDLTSLRTHTSCAQTHRGKIRLNCYLLPLSCFIAYSIAKTSGLISRLSCL